MHDTMSKPARALTRDLELGGRARDAKGLGSIEATLELLLDLLARAGRP